MQKKMSKKREWAIQVGKSLLDIWNEPTVKLLPAHLAYFVILSLVPILIIIFFSAQYFSLPLEEYISTIEGVLPEAISALLTPTEERASTLGVGIWMIVALFTGSNGMNAVMLGADSLYRFDTSNPIVKRIKAVVLTLILIVLVLICLALVTLGEVVLTSISGNLQGIISVLRWIAVFVFAFFSVKLIYSVAPHQRIPSRYTTWGSIFTLAAWVVAAVCYSFYYTHFSDYSQIYGALENLIVIMIMVYLFTTVFVMGLVINVYHYRIQASEKMPTLSARHKNSEKPLPFE